jgi:hypothetical protein
VRSWLEGGEPAPLELLHERRHDEFMATVTDWLEGRRVERLIEPGLPDDSPEVFGSEVHALMLAMLATPATGVAGRRPDWEPRELTGAEPIDEDDLEES